MNALDKNKRYKEEKNKEKMALKRDEKLNKQREKLKANKSITKKTKVVKIKKTKTKSRSKLIKELDSIFSKFVRLSWRIKGTDNCKCYTCGKVDNRKNLQNGHFISRKNYKYRWSIHNTRPQCIACNIFLKGNYIIYTTKMIEEYGIEKIKEMQNDKELVKIRTTDISYKIGCYQKYVEDMENGLIIATVKKV